MSFVSDFLFGDDPTPTTVEDTRPQEAINLQGQTLRDLADISARGGLPTFQGPTTAPIGGLESDLLARLAEMFSPGGSGGINTARDTLQSIAGGTGAGTGVNPVLTRSDGLLSQNPIFGPNANQGQATNPIFGQTTGQGQELNPIFGATSRFPGEVDQTFQQIFDILSGATQSGDNPILQSAIDAATRPILERFGDQAALDRGAFTQAGQFVQPGSSSPFETARSRLDVGLANALGDTGANLAFQNLTQERGRQSGLISELLAGFESQQGRELDLTNILSGAFNAEQGRALDLTNILSGAFDTSQGRELDLTNILSQAFEAGEGREATAEERQLAAAAETAPFEATQIDSITGALDDAALPRLIEQFGLNQGQEQFNQQQDSLMEVLRLMVGGNQPNTVVLPGDPGGGGILAPLLNAGATAVGGGLGGAASSFLAGLF